MRGGDRARADNLSSWTTDFTKSREKDGGRGERPIVKGRFKYSILISYILK